MSVGSDAVKAGPVGLGFRVKSGWATTFLLAGTDDAPRVLDRCTVDLSDPDQSETHQPFHAGTGWEETNAAKIKRRVKIIERAVHRSVVALMDRYRELGVRVGGAALVVGSVVDPDSIANPHLRAHACEGKLFRTVLADALRASGVRSRIFIERNVYAEAMIVLKRPEAEIKRALTELGRQVGRPWSADEKLAALAAWLTRA